MDQEPGHPTRGRPVVVSPTDLAELPEQQTHGIRRQQAFAADDRWIGYIRTTPGEWSGWHHHGETDTYFYVLCGGLEFELRADDATVRVGPGDFAHMPAGVVHRERTAPGQGGEAILVRIGRGPAVVNVDDPAAAD